MLGAGSAGQEPGLFTVPAWLSHTPEHLHILFLAHLWLWSQLTLKLSSEEEK